MLQQLRKKGRKGFTLVEIMIVVAIIALLAAIAVPNFLRARKRSQATRVIEDMRLVEAAKDQWALENNKKGTDNVVWADVVPYLKTTSELGKSEGKDTLQGDITLTTVDAPPTVSQETATLLEEATGTGTAATAFWGAYAPATKK